MQPREALQRVLRILQTTPWHVDKAELFEVVEAALASAPPAAEPVGMKLVPMIPTAEMNRVMDSEGWCWEDVLAAAGVITEDEYQDIAASGTHQPAAPQPAEPAQPAAQAGAGELPDQMDAIALARFKVQPTTSGYWGWCVKAGDGDAELYKGHKSDCELVARRMLGAFLDGGHKALELLAAQPTAQPSQDANPTR